MEGRNEYELATALLQFKVAYSVLCKASRNMPDLDMSDNYPFYLLDFEDIEPAVIQWCNLHSNKLMEQVPDRVDNPACVECSKFRSGLAANGTCKGGPCNNYPYVIFSREMCTPLLVKYDTVAIPARLTDANLHACYIALCDKLYKKKE